MWGLEWRITKPSELKKKGRLSHTHWNLLRSRLLCSREAATRQSQGGRQALPRRAQSTAVSSTISVPSDPASPKSFRWTPRALLLKSDGRGFPGGPVVKNPPPNIKDASLNPGQGTKILHATGQQSLCTATTEPLLCNERRPHAAMKTQHCRKNKQIVK